MIQILKIKNNSFIFVVVAMTVIAKALFYLFLQKQME